MVSCGQVIDRFFSRMVSCCFQEFSRRGEKPTYEKRKFLYEVKDILLYIKYMWYNIIKYKCVAAADLISKKEGVIMISYDGLWKLLIDKKMNKTDLQRKANLSSRTVAKMAKCKPVSLTVLEKICIVLKCDFGDIISYQDEERIIDEFEL